MTPFATPALRIEGLKSPLAGPFDLSLGAGGCVGITGASGAGKSLFLRMVADLDPNEGEVWLAGEPRSGMSGPAWRRSVVYTPAESGWWSDHVIAHFAKPQRDAAWALAARLGLPDGVMNGPVSRLSTGERQRIALIRTLVAAPRVLLLDEPTSGLDSDGIERTEQLLRERMAEGVAIILVTHNAGQAARIAQSRLIMSAGRLAPA